MSNTVSSDFLKKLKSLEEYDEAEVQNEQDTLLANAYGFADEVATAVSLMTKKHDLGESYLYTYAPSIKVRPGQIKFDSLITSIHRIRALNNDVTYNKGDGVYRDSANRIVVGLNTCDQIIYNKNLLQRFFDDIIKDEMENQLGRKYKLAFYNGTYIFDKDDIYIEATDLTVAEYLDIKFGEDRQYSVMLIPLIGQIYMAYFICVLIYALFTKKLRTK